jgi:hypothetical protein
MRHASLAVLFVLALAPHFSQAETIIVDLNGSGDFLTIGEGVDAADNGDTVLVYPGSYVGGGNCGITFGGKAIVLCSRDGRDETILDLGYERLCSAFVFDSLESRDTVLDGFTVREAVEDGGCSGFVCDYAWPTIRNCRFTHCWAYGNHHIEGWCAAGCVSHGGPLFENCVFDGNHANSRCGGVCVGASSVSTVFRGCVFASNSDGFEGTGSLDVFDESSATLEHCVFIGHDSYGRVVTIGGTSDISLLNCTIAGNGGYVQNLIGGWGSGGTVDISNSIFAFNSCDALAAVEATVTVTHSCLYETGADSLYSNASRELNIRVDPLFCNMTGDDYTLCANSPCLPDGNDWTEDIGAYGQGCPTCDSPVQPMSWGTIKALFR